MTEINEMRAQHTPGPWFGGLEADDWSVDAPWDGLGCITEMIGAKGRPYPLAPVVQRDMAVYGDGDAELTANVALLTTAPELLEALEAVVRVADRKTVEFDLARAAIAKAKGLRP